MRVFNPEFEAKVHRKRRQQEAMAKLERMMAEEVAKANQIMRRRGVGATGRAIISEIAKAYNLSPVTVLAYSTSLSVASKARREAAYLMRAARPKEPFSWPVIGRWLGVDHTTALYAAEMHALATGLPSLSPKGHTRARIRHEQERAAV